MLSPHSRLTCACSREKNTGFAFCYACTLMLPEELRIRSFEEGLGEKYQRACEHLGLAKPDLKREARG